MFRPKTVSRYDDHIITELQEFLPREEHTKVLDFYRDAYLRRIPGDHASWCLHDAIYEGVMEVLAQCVLDE